MNIKEEFNKLTMGERSTLLGELLVSENVMIDIQTKDNKAVVFYITSECIVDQGGGLLIKEPPVTQKMSNF